MPRSKRDSPPSSPEETHDDPPGRRRNPRRETRSSPVSVDSDMDDTHESDQGEESSSDDLMDVRRRGALRTGNRNDKPGALRTSSRSTKFNKSMKEPAGESIADLFNGVSMKIGPKNNNSSSNNSNNSNNKRKSPDQKPARGGKKARDSASSSDGGSELKTTPSLRRTTSSSRAHKSPATRHSTKRGHAALDDSSVSTEDDDDSDEEEEEDELKIQRIIASRMETCSAWRNICKDMTTSEVSQGSRWFQDEDESRDNDIEERFLVKWYDLSYLHCSWETQADLAEQVESSKTYITTFFRKAVNGLLFTADERGDGEYFDPSFTQVERIIDIKVDGDPNEEMVFDPKDPEFENGTGRQFLIKWVNCPYSDTTYEFERDLIINEIEFEDQLKEFETRRQKPTMTKMKRAYKQRTEEIRRLKKLFSDEEGIEDYQRKIEKHVFPNGGQLRDYQAEGVAWLLAHHVNNSSSILADEMGLGKTIQTAAYVDLVARDIGSPGPFLVVAPLSTLQHWYREFSNWTNLNTIVYHGSAEDREFIRQYEMAYESDRPKNVGINSSYLKRCHDRNSGPKRWMVNVVITTPEMLVASDYAELTHIQWDIMVVDEAHRLKNHTSKLAQNLRDPRFDIKHTLLLTGTPIQNNMQEMWTLLNIVDEETFPDSDAFIDKFGDVKSKEAIDELHELIRPYMLRRLKEDVEKSVPPKEETLIEVELTVLQKQYYRALYEKNVSFLNRNQKKDGPSLNNLAMQLRKCCNHPFLLTGVEQELREEEAKSGTKTPEADFLVNSSGKLVLLDKLLPRLKETGHRILIFSQFKIMLDVLEDYLRARRMPLERIDGSITGNKRQRAIDRFQAEDVEGKESPFIMLLSTRAGGVGINLTAADTVIIFDSDWNPQNDLQAQARCHRIGQKKNVKVYRLLTRKTYEMQMFHMSSLKMGLDQAVLKGVETGGTVTGEAGLSKEEIEKLLRHGAYDIFNEEKAGTAEDESNAFVQQDIDSILERRSKTVVHDNKEGGGGAAGSTFSKASFKAAKNSQNDDAVTEDVDVDDPEFWKKMVGEAAPEKHVPDLPGRRRNRGPKSYSEKDYDRKIRETLEMSDDAMAKSSQSDGSSSAEDPGSDDEVMTNARERERWGGKRPSEWNRDDVERILKVLDAYGYGTIPFSAFIQKASFRRSNYSVVEIKRMCWALVLTTLLEAAKREGAAKAAKIKESETSSLEQGGDGGVLAEAAANAKDSEEQVEVRFKKLVKENADWVSKALSDASSTTTVIRPRAEESLASATPSTNKSVSLDESFKKSVVPALLSRGWKIEEVVERSDAMYSDRTYTLYSYKGNSFRSTNAMIKAVPLFHPELSSSLGSILALETDLGLGVPEPGIQSPIVPVVLNLFTLTANSLTEFLEKYAPLQLLFDRRMQSKVSLQATRMKTLCLLGAAHALVSAKQVTDGATSAEEMVAKLAKLLPIDKKLALPHPSWTPWHDATLIFAITKHGWLDRSSKGREIAQDATIKWGHPFDQHKLSTDAAAPKEKVPTLESMAILKETAARAAKFFNIEYELIQTLKGFNEDIITEAYGLVHCDEEENESGTFSWKVDEELLKTRKVSASGKVDSDHLAELPPKNVLTKRAKAILKASLNGVMVGLTHFSTTENESKSANSEQQFPLLDQSDRCNLLLAEMLLSLLRGTSKQGGITIPRKLIAYAIQEARSRQAAEPEGSRREEMRKIVDTIQFVGRHWSGGNTRAVKNVVRVMLGSQPVLAKNSIEPLYPMNKSPVLAFQELGEEVSPRKENTVSADEGIKKLGKNNRPKNDKAAGDVAVIQGVALVFTAQRKHGAPMQQEREALKFTKNHPQLQLTAVETLILTVLLSRGIPVWKESWEDLVQDFDLDMDENCGPGFKYGLTWYDVGALASTAAMIWYNSALARLEQKKKHGQSSASLEVEIALKARALQQAKDYASSSTKLAKKCVMLIATLKKWMGGVDRKPVYGAKKVLASNRTENGLGPRVLLWCEKNVAKWAHCLQITDHSDRPLAHTASDFIWKVPEHRDDPELGVFALMDKKKCRTIFGQIAQQTRLRSIFMAYGPEKTCSLVKQAVKNSKNNDDAWDARPDWWGSQEGATSRHSHQDDYDLLDGLLNSGYGSVQDMFASKECFRIRLQDVNEEILSNAAVQKRANQLTRELSAIDDTEDAIRLVRACTGKPQSKKRKDSPTASVQTGIDCFFKTASKPATAEVINIESDSESDAQVPSRREGEIVVKLDASPEKKVKSSP